MTPLFDKNGQVAAFLGANGRIVGTSGASIAWTSAGGVFDYSGNHLGWWDNDHMRGPDGGVVVRTREAHTLGITPRLPAQAPLPPTVRLEPARPMTQTPPMRPSNRGSWSSLTLSE